MGEFRPDNLIVKCYAYKIDNNRWYSKCLDFNIGIEADDPEELKSKMLNAVSSYIDAVYDTEDKDSIPRLMKRKAPLSDWMRYYAIRGLFTMRKIITIPGKFIFNEAVPIHLAHNYC